MYSESLKVLNPYEALSKSIESIEQNTLKKALQVYGEVAQINMVFEEM